MDRVLPSEGRGCWFDPSRARQALRRPAAKQNERRESVNASTGAARTAAYDSPGFTRRSFVPRMVHAFGEYRFRSRAATALSIAALAVLAACGSAPGRPPTAASVPPVVPRPGAAPFSERDGAQARTPADLSRV